VKFEDDCFGWSSRDGYSKETVHSSLGQWWTLSGGVETHHYLMVLSSRLVVVRDISAGNVAGLRLASVSRNLANFFT
jgi:hypothetical protein